MKIIKLNPIFLLTLILFGCGTTSSKTPSPQNQVKLESIGEKTPNPEGLRHFMDGQMMMNQGDFAMAILEFQQALELDPGVGAIHTSIAESYWNLGKPDMAEKHLNIAIGLDPSDEQALQMLADQYILQKKYEAAQQPFNQLHKLKPDDAKYIIALAELEKVKQNISGAIQLYLEAFDLDPSRLELLETGGRLALQNKDFIQAQSIFKRLTFLDPDQPKYMGMYIDLIMNSKNYKEGIDALKSMNAEYGDSPDRTAQMGLLMYRAGQKEEALGLLETAIEATPENPNYYFPLFDLYMDNNNYEKASKVADKLVSNFPEDWRGYYSRSLVYLEDKNPGNVITLLEPVSDTFNKIYSIQYLLGLSHNQLKQFEDAQKYFSKALTIRPDSPNVLHSMAILYDEVKEWDKSDKIYLRLIKTDSTDAQAFNNYAYSLVERNQELKKALTLAKKAIALEPENASYLDTIGWIYFKLDNHEKAQAYIELSVKINGENAIVLEHLGDVLMKIQKTDDAMDYYKRALSLDKNNVRLINKASPE
ncbi:MAG: tetratricopeptide repeat protein [Candidatus Marinimicrobia bacterium]|nr:tetratricopeptide repeat protein [Candidatus Neomarinimicrobiota bacterium]MBL7030370.1 tetratricopeptide repeat protein [Candidatus Neomarinimicrobiota bacterium]